MNIFWFIPTHGDSRYLGTSKGARAADHDYFQQIAIAADTLGYEGVLLPTGRSCEDAWVVASSLIGVTRRLKFLVAIRPGISSPGLAAGAGTAIRRNAVEMRKLMAGWCRARGRFVENFLAGSVESSQGNPP